MLPAMLEVVFLIPSFHPTDHLLALLKRLREQCSSPIVVVDDGSGPKYRDFFAQAAAIENTVVLTNAVNLGKGSALKHGMNYALVHYPDCAGVVTADADGQHDVADILAVAAELRHTPGEVIFGTRRFAKDVPLRSRFGNTVSRYIYRLLIGLRLSDTQTGLRGVPRRLVELSLAIRANRYEFETEQLIVLKNAALKIREVPIRTIYIDCNRESHFRPLVDSLKIYFVLIRYGVSSAAAAATDLTAFWIVLRSTDSILVSNMLARAVSLWVQLALLQTFVFKRRVDLRIFLEYIALVFLSGLMSSALQSQMLPILPFPLVGKIIGDTLVFLFNFLFIRDFIFGRWTANPVED